MTQPPYFPTPELPEDRASLPRPEVHSHTRTTSASVPNRRLWVHFALFLLTVGTTFYAAFSEAPPELRWSHGVMFSACLMSILLAHEFGHYIAARLHKVPASLPFFIPMPFGPFGTMGAVISMRGRIASRKALLDIGAAGPIAGLVVALPTLVVGLRLSAVHVVTGHGILEGQSLLYLALKRLVVGSIPPGSDVFLHPVAFAGWIGLFITMINLLPVGQLDGGHIAYALFGPIQDKIALAVHYALPVLFLGNLVRHLIPALHSPDLFESVFMAVNNSLAWLVWFGVLFALFRLGGGRKHPPTDAVPLGRGRSAIAVGCLILFVLLFMPTPLSTY